MLDIHNSYYHRRLFVTKGNHDVSYRTAFIYLSVHKRQQTGFIKEHQLRNENLANKCQKNPKDMLLFLQNTERSDSYD